MSERNKNRKAQREWSNQVKERDGYKCQLCNSTNRLHAHHIIPWKIDILKRYDIENGITYCQSCHAKKEGFQKGHPVSDHIRKAVSLSTKKRIPWNKGKISPWPEKQICKSCGIEKNISEYYFKSNKHRPVTICKTCEQKKALDRYRRKNAIKDS